MRQGPWALFWAIVAVGVGPAMWLGVQFGEATYSPGPVSKLPGAVTVRDNSVVVPAGGAGAGVGDEPTVVPTGEPERPHTEPPRDSRPVRSSPSPSTVPSLDPSSASNPDGSLSPSPAYPSGIGVGGDDSTQPDPDDQVSDGTSDGATLAEGR